VPDSAGHPSSTAHASDSVVDGIDPDVVMRRVALGDESAFADLYDRLVPSVYRLVRLVLGSPADVDAVVAAAFAELWTRAVDPGLTAGLTVETWALATAYRTATGRRVGRWRRGNLRWVSRRGWR